MDSSVLGPLEVGRDRARVRIVSRMQRRLLALLLMHGRTPSQVAIRWALQHGSVTIPKSINPERIAQNSGVFSFQLTGEQMQAIDRLDRGAPIGPDPEHLPAGWA